eukprot:scaffold871_cov101-Phaeocystis_antarctica.AAC.1
MPRSRCGSSDSEMRRYSAPTASLCGPTRRRAKVERHAASSARTYATGTQYSPPSCDALRVPSQAA